MRGKQDQRDHAIGTVRHLPRAPGPSCGMEPWRLAADVTLGVGLDNQRCMSVRSERQRAFEELFATHYWAVRGYVLRRCRASVADDVLADTFLVAWRRFDSVPDDPLPWLLGVARRLLAISVATSAGVSGSIVVCAVRTW